MMFAITYKCHITFKILVILNSLVCFCLLFLLCKCGYQYNVNACKIKSITANFSVAFES